MDDRLEVRIADPPRPAPGDLRQLEEADPALEETGVETAGTAEPDEMEAESRDEEVIDEEIAPGGGLRLGGKEIQPDDMAELKEDVEKTREMIPGKLLVDWPRCSGPHWPLPETDPIGDWARLLRRIR